MNKKIIFLSVLIFAILVLIGFFWMNKDRSIGRHSPSQSSPEKRIKYYTCSMHSGVHSDKPGTCPICGMALNPVYENSEGDSSETTPSSSHSETSHSPTATYPSRE